ncbi:MAG: roadblock/LC7 domain-containing protein [Candidatus Zipacnadales bacterium]
MSGKPKLLYEVSPLAEVQEILHQLRQRNPDISTAVLATIDGLAVHSDTVSTTDVDTLAAMAADICVRANRMAEEVGQGCSQQFLLQADGGYIVVNRVGTEFCLVVLAKAESSLGLLLISVRKAAAEIPPDQL